MKHADSRDHHPNSMRWRKDRRSMRKEDREREENERHEVKRFPLFLLGRSFVEEKI